jgi:tRNA-2-methylthio-N6-dimethylallyladenosine synthase
MRTTRIVLKVDRKDVSYLRWTIESYDGMALVSTLDPAQAQVEIRIAPGCESIVTDLLDHLAREERVGIACLHGGLV